MNNYFVVSSEGAGQATPLYEGRRLSLRYNAFPHLYNELKISYVSTMKNVSMKKNLDSISRDAMKSQRVSFRIEGMNISKKRAEQIRREVVREFLNGSATSGS